MRLESTEIRHHQKAAAKFAPLLKRTTCHDVDIKRYRTFVLLREGIQHAMLFAVSCYLSNRPAQRARCLGVSSWQGRGRDRIEKTVAHKIHKAMRRRWGVHVTPRGTIEAVDVSDFRPP